MQLNWNNYAGHQNASLCQTQFEPPWLNVMWTEEGMRWLCCHFDTIWAGVEFTRLVLKFGFMVKLREIPLVQFLKNCHMLKNDWWLSQDKIKHEFDLLDQFHTTRNINNADVSQNTSERFKMSQAWIRMRYNKWPFRHSMKRITHCQIKSCSTYQKYTNAAELELSSAQ